MRSARAFGCFALLVLVASPAFAQRAQRRPIGDRGFVSVNVAVQQAASSLRETFNYEFHVEQGTIDVEYPGNIALEFDAAAGRRFWNRWGVALAGSRTSASGGAPLRAEVPHPLFDDRHRAVEGSARDVGRTEMALHVQVYYEPRPRGRTRLRFFGGPSIFRVEQRIVESIDVDEFYPFDTATFRSAQTVRAKGSGAGVNVGLDVNRMLGRRFGAGIVLRYTRAALDLNADGSRTVSTDGGGLQAGGGLRMIF